MSGGTSVIEQDAWQSVTFENSWVNYNAGGWPVASFFKDSLGIVHLKGLVKDGTIGTVIFTLPAGYRPARDTQFAVASNDVYGQIYISNTGGVSATVGSNTWLSLAGVTFRAEQ